MKTAVNKRKKVVARQFTLVELHRALQERMVGHPDNLRAPSMPTLKNLSRTGALKKGQSLDQAVAFIVGHLGQKARYYVQESSPDKQEPPAVEGGPLTPGHLERLMERMLTAVENLEQRISNIENRIATEVRYRESAIDPRVSQAIEQLDATRKHVMNRLDGELQALKGSGGGRGFDGASAMDAARILAGVSQIKDMLGRWEPVTPMPAQRR